MSYSTFNMLKLFYILDQQSITFTRTPEPTYICELCSMYIISDRLYWASLDNLVSNEGYINLSTYLDTIPAIGKYHRNLCM
jgi:hypothetical protein